MCLILKPDSKINRAEGDVICYKILKKVDSIEVFHLGDNVGLPVATIIDGKLIFSTLNQELLSNINERTIEKVRNNPALTVSKPKTNYVTFPRCNPVEIGKTYYSKLKKEVEECYANSPNMSESVRVNIGLHSYSCLEQCLEEAWLIEKMCIAECIIPSGFYYYKGEYGHSGLYVSNALKYVRIISEQD